MKNILNTQRINKSKQPKNLLLKISPIKICLGESQTVMTIRMNMKSLIERDSTSMRMEADKAEKSEKTKGK
jgi:hypothetical protein